MNKRGKAVIGIEAKSNVRKGVQDAERQLNELKAPLANIQKLAGMAFAGFSAYAVVNGIKDVVQASAKQQAIFNDLRATVEHLGISYDAVSGSLQKTFRHLQDVTTYGDTDSARVLTDLITLTGDYQGSLKALPLVLDMAASGQFDVRTAARYMAMAMKGNITMLGRYIPELRSSSNALMAHATEAQKAEYAMKMLEKHFGGRAQAEVNTTIGQYKQLANEFGDLKEAVGDLVSGPLGKLMHVTSEAVRSLHEFFEAIQDKKARTEAAHQSLKFYVGSMLSAIPAMRKFGLSLMADEIAKNKDKEATEDLSDELRKLRKEYNALTHKDHGHSDTLTYWEKIQKMKKAILEQEQEEKIKQEALWEIEKERERIYQQKLKRLGIANKEIIRENNLKMRAAELSKEELLAINGLAPEIDTATASQQLFNAALEQSKFAAQDLKYELEGVAQEFANIFMKNPKDFKNAKEARNYVWDQIKNTWIRLHFDISGAMRIMGMQSGGSFKVPGTGIGDRPYLIGLEPGEHVTVTPKNETREINQKTVIIHQYHIQAIDAESFQKFMRRKGYEVIDQDAGLGYL